MRERPILRQNRGPQQATANPTATGGEYLGDLIVQADVLRLELGYQRWADLKPLCDGNDPRTLNRRGLVWLIGQLGLQKRQRQLTIFDVLEGQGDD
ncbi:hypothetical protein [Leptolyngbya sp. KIOST-1]|uniref:hypothetical protein n=1 Tax=Leptolyngbya sp. KIOST-1 TaxID=1229172 RepID=UPI00055C0C2B|nr:hypothetical protein [Leptolyngbya sp. KIOST-1]